MRQPLAAAAFRQIERPGSQTRPRALLCCAAMAGLFAGGPARADDRIRQSDDEIRVVLTDLQAAVRKKGYVSGVAAQSFLDKRTGFRDPGYGLDIVDWIMEPGSDEAYRDRLDNELLSSAAFIVGFFDTIEEMHSIYDEHAGAIGLVVDERGWRLVK